MTKLVGLFLECELHLIHRNWKLLSNENKFLENGKLIVYSFSPKAKIPKYENGAIIVLYIFLHQSWVIKWMNIMLFREQYRILPLKSKLKLLFVVFFLWKNKYLKNIDWPYLYKNINGL